MFQMTSSIFKHSLRYLAMLGGLLSMAANASALTIDFSSGSWNVGPPSTYSQDGFLVEILELSQGVDPSSPTLGKWKWFNHPHCIVACGPHQHLTFLSFSGGAYDLDNVLIFENPAGLRFSAGTGALLQVDPGIVGPVTFPSEFDNITLLQIAIPIVTNIPGQGFATIGSFNVVPEPSTGVFLAAGLAGLGWAGRRRVAL